tara:strand:- start:200 stop:358 length:159 start_codon:yes stop_codon:yes gene_type:complete
MNLEEKLKTINEATEQSLTMEYIEEGAVDFGISTDEILDLMLEDINQNKEKL